MGSGGPAAGQGRGQADLSLDRVFGLPLVPRDGAGVLRGSRDGGDDQRALRPDQGRPRGTTRRGRPLHGGRAGDDRPGWLAAQRLPRPRGRSLLRGHLLPARAPPRPAELPPGARGDLGGLPPEARRAAAVLGPHPRGTVGRRAHRAIAGPVDPRAAGAGAIGPARARRQHPRRLRRRSQVPAGERARVPARARQQRACGADPRRDAEGRHLRPDRGRLRALLG